MANDPNCVRLANRLTGGMLADVHGSGWSIAGYDVRKFPSDVAAQRFVRRALNDGTLEPCSQAEWDEVHDDPVTNEALRQRPDFVQDAGFQEAHVQRAAAAGTAKLAAQRVEDDDPEEAGRERAARVSARQGTGKGKRKAAEETPPAE